VTTAKVVGNESLVGFLNTKGMKSYNLQLKNWMLQITRSYWSWL